MKKLIVILFPFSLMIMTGGMCSNSSEFAGIILTTNDTPVSGAFIYYTAYPTKTNKSFSETNGTFSFGRMNTARDNLFIIMKEGYISTQVMIQYDVWKNLRALSAITLYLTPATNEKKLIPVTQYIAPVKIETNIAPVQTNVIETKKSN